MYVKTKYNKIGSLTSSFEMSINFDQLVNMYIIIKYFWKHKTFCKSVGNVNHNYRTTKETSEKCKKMDVLDIILQFTIFENSAF